MNGPSVRYLTQRSKRDASERNLVALASILGVDIAEATLPEDAAIGDAWFERYFETPALISSAETIAALLARNRAGFTDLDSLTSRLRFLMIYGIERCAPASAKRLFGSSPMLVVTPSVQRRGNRYHLPAEGAAISLQLAGTSFEAAAIDQCVYSLSRAVFAKRAFSDSTVRLIDHEGVPFFAALLRPHCEIFYLASSDLFDVNTPAPSGELPLAAYPGLLPWLLFLRRAAGDRCWRNHAPRACLIIDDPPLQPRYGFLSYSAMVDAMQRARFSTSIAFIPWNRSRSAGSTAQLFKRNSSMLSLCVHGCDHTGGEFASTNVDLLRHKSRTALQRMELHERATGIGWDPVMVFPQGLFSTASLAVLKQEGFIAAVNSGIASFDEPETCRVADFLVPASTVYGGVPLFNRHYPRDLLPFALDLFLGRPVLITEHHTYFRSGYGTACEFAMRLNAMEPRLSWGSLVETLCKSVQSRVTASEFELRAYTDQTIVGQKERNSEYCKLIKPETDPDSVCDVLVNGRPAQYRLTDKRIEVQIDVPGEFWVAIHRRQNTPSSVMVPGWPYGAKVAARRYLCEIRDNVPSALARWIPEPLARRMFGAFL